MLGALTDEQIHATALAIREQQTSTGMILWFEGHADTWNHTEAAMALSTVGLRAAAEQAFDWLARTQRSDAVGITGYLSDGLEDAGGYQLLRLRPPVCYIISDHWR